VIRVLIVDDQPLVRSGITTILRAAPDIDVVGEADDGLPAVRLAQELRPDVVCMDVQMPGMDGLEATRRIVAAGVDAAVLVLTTFDSDQNLFAALEAGASGFLLKTAGSDNLVDAVRVLASGDALLAPEVTRRVIRRSAGALPLRPRAEPTFDRLTEREREVLRLLAAGQSNREIAETLYIGEATVKTHLSALLMKLGVRDRVQAVVFAYRAGFMDDA
jgi:DNA-binding NarL/FixJ family response regulator